MHTPNPGSDPRSDEQEGDVQPPPVPPDQQEEVVPIEEPPKPGRREPPPMIVRYSWSMAVAPMCGMLLARQVA